MASPLSEAEVRRIATLARLELTETEVQRFATQLTAIVGYAAAIDEADTSRVSSRREPTSSVTRDDATRPGLDRETALAGAPDAAPGAGLFRVPKVL